MLKLTLTTLYKAKKKLVLYVSTNITMTECDKTRYPKCNTTLMDGRHNNGGWTVVETIEEIEEMIDNQL